MRALWMCLMLALVLAGCTESVETQEDPDEETTDDPTAPPTEATEEPTEPSEPITDDFHLNGAGLGVVSVVDPSSDHRFAFDVPTGATVHATSTWTCVNDPVCQMRFFVFEDGEEITSVAGTSPLEIQQELGAGTYALAMFPEYIGGVAVEASGTFEIVME